MATVREYRLIARVGETDFAETCRAVASGEEGRQPARLLVLKPWAADPEVSKALAARLDRIVQVRFPNLWVPWSFGQAGDRLIVAMPSQPGVSLATVVARVRAKELSLGLDLAVHIVAEAANGLAGLHQAGLVHGGIGLEDVMLGLDGSVRLVCDGVRLAFEMAPATRPQGLGATTTYRAPEVLQGAPPDGAADVYALGTVAFELATGERVDTARVAAAESDPPQAIRRPSEIDRAIPARFDDVLLSAIDLDPSRRPGDGASLRDALWEYLDGMGQVVTPAQLADLVASVPPSEGDPGTFDPEEPSDGSVPLSTEFALSPIDLQSLAGARTYQFDDDAPERSEGGAPGSAFPSKESVTENTVKVAIPLSDPEEESEAPPTGSEDAHRLTTTPLIRDPHAALPGEVPSVHGSDPFRPATRVDSAPPDAEAPDADALYAGARDVDVQGAGASGADLAGGAIPDPIDPTEETDRPAPPSPQASPPYAASVPTTNPRVPTAQTAQRPRKGLHLGWVAVIALVVGAGGFAAGRFTAPLPVTTGSTSDWADMDFDLPPLVDLTGESETDPSEAPAEALAAADDEGADGEVDEGADDASEDASEADAVAEAPEPPPPAKATPRRRPPRQKQARRPPPRGRITIIADHRAQVFIDGRDTGRHTPLQGYLVPAGRREVKLVAANGRTHTEEVVIRANQVTQLRVAMR